MVTTNFCTDWWDGVWGQCCAAHDAAYAAGVDKMAADFALGECVAHTGNLAMGLVMLLGVSLFGWIFYKKARKSNG